MKAYLGAKFYEDMRNRRHLEEITEQLEKAGFKVLLVVRDHENWGENEYTSRELMKRAFQDMDKSDIIVIEFSEKGVGLGIEAGYAYAKKKPLIVIAKKGSHISNTMNGTASKIIFYEKTSQLANEFKKIKV
jgi:nucleoside 2-deoxyribosyltransferase